ncbi:MAG: Acetyltransferase, GNAT family [candidate division CPR2 bacterium GW2011_GWC1_39_9]|uniref:Acetyltransferase, GNAT family n=1 Tax=candidate division CPR2 bacterium GW2011_GWC2_39_10 TaxID=1618345 RepID=A0A0G0LV01_UNCC2|nr:MAG: Acetyltransferase, GNAT family [candidate division CPR2 bacterium GW2011_GWC2_39_10]KKR34522.1 MAG: Acetyltransferase, GNAT family [candidate division CPR2 bacterium GW2011_GWC1_39_9]
MKVTKKAIEEAYDKIEVREVNLEEIVKINDVIPEFEKYNSDYFSERMKDKDNLVIAGYIQGKDVGYIVGYDKFGDGSFYCWMAAINPEYRRKGVLNALMDYEEKWAKKRGYEAIKIKTRNVRREMLANLVKSGFYFTGVEEKADIKDYRINLIKKI